MEEVHLWMIDQHLGRRSVSDFQRGVLALRKRAILAERRAQAIAAIASLPAEEQKSAALTKEKQALRAQVAQLQAQFQSPETHQAGA